MEPWCKRNKIGEALGSSLYQCRRFPGAISSHGARLYYRFCLSLRDVEELEVTRFSGSSGISVQRSEVSDALRNVPRALSEKAFL